MVSRGSPATWAHLLWAISKSLYIPTTVAHKKRIRRLIATMLLRNFHDVWNRNNSELNNAILQIIFLNCSKHVHLEITDLFGMYGHGEYTTVPSCL